MVLDKVGSKLGSIPLGEELLGEGSLDGVGVLSLAGHGDVELGRLGVEDLGVESLLGQVELEAIGLVNVDGGGLAVDLGLARLAVDNVDRRDDRVEDDVGLLAAIFKVFTSGNKKSTSGKETYRG